MVLNRTLVEFKRPAVSKVMTVLSKSTEVHLPPWVMTPKRLYQMASIVCPFSLKNMTGSANNQAISVRYISNYNALDRYFFGFLVGLHGLEQRACELDGTSILNEISQAEYLLHQALLGRLHVFSNTQKIRGNALKVRII